MKKDHSKNVIIALLVVIIIILASLVVLFATDTISFNFKPNDHHDISNEEGSNNSEEEHYAVWMEYILAQNITNVSIDRSRAADNPEDDYFAKINLTTEQLKGLFSELTDCKLVKYYLQGSGFTYGDIITISYTANSDEYSVQIANGHRWADNMNLRDHGLLNALENSDHTVQNEDIKNAEGAYYNFWFQGYDETILDVYFD